MTQELLAQALALHRAGRLQEAEQAYRSLLAEQPDANVMQLLATLLHQDGRSAQALPLLDRAIEQLGRNSALLNNRSAMLLALDRPAEALAVSQSVLADDPDSPGAAHNTRVALHKLAAVTDDLVERCDWYRQYLEAGGDDPVALLDYANALRRGGRARQALPLFQRAAREAPDSGELGSAALIAACFDPGATTASLARQARELAPRYARAQRAAPATGPAWGFFSPRFGDGPMASLVLPVLEALSQRGISLVLLSGYQQPASGCAPFRSVADHWVETAPLDDDQLHTELRRLGVGTLFDLCGHSPHNRLAGFGSGLAAKQLLWGDWFGPVGMPGYTAYVGDAVANPAREDDCFDQTVLRLPGGRFTYRAPAGLPLPQPPDGAAPRLVSFNRLAKLTDVTLACWSAILTALPGATLELRSDGLEYGSVRAQVAQRFAEAGVGAERLLLKPFSSYAEVMRAYRGAALALDPFPFNGCVTTFDALVMGVPVVALHGATPVARQSASILQHAGLGDWVAGSESAYIECAVALARAPLPAHQRLLDFRSHALLDADAFTGQLLHQVCGLD